ncbi:MAG: hypothetical protein ACFE9L_00110 [Candidatus Hodarchaeota archaeon]
MSKSNERKWSPFFLQKVDESLTVLKVHVKARVIKTREIYLLEWAIMAPSYELNPRPTLEEIKHELGITKMDFLMKTAGELQTLGLLELKDESQYQLTESGEKLYQQKKMISDPRNIHFPIFREASSSEWLIGIDKLENTEISETIDETLSIPSYIPEKIIRNHVGQLKKILKPEEELLEHEVDDIDQLWVNIKVNLFLTKEGLMIRVSEHPFSNKHNQLLNKILYEQFMRNGLMEKHLTNIRDSSPYNSTLSTQVHQIETDVKLFLPTDINKVFNEFFILNEKWMITNIQNSPEIIQHQSKKPQIIVYLTRNGFNSKEIKLETIDKNNTFFPSSLQIQIDHSEVQIQDNTILSKEKQAVLTNVEVNGFEIPLFIINKDNTSKNYRIALMNEILNKMDEHSFERNIAMYYLTPSIETLRSLLLTIPIQIITDGDKAEGLIIEILELQETLDTEVYDLELNKDLINKIFSFYSWEEIIKFDPKRLLLNYEVFLARLDLLMKDKLNVRFNDTWNMFHESITEIGDVYKDLHKIKVKFQKALSTNNIVRIEKDLDHRLNQYLDIVESIVKRIPKPINVHAYEDLFNKLEVFESNRINETFLNVLRDSIKAGSVDFEPIEMLSVQSFLSKNNRIPTNKELKNYASLALRSIDLNFTEKDGIKLIRQITTQVSSIDSDISITKDVLKILPQEVLTNKDQSSIRYLVANLKELHLLFGNDINNYVKKIVKQIEKSLQPQTFSELELWLLFLERVKSVLERSLRSTIIKINTKHIWGRTVPYLEEDSDREKVVRNSLGQLKLGSQLKKWRKEQKKEKVSHRKDKSNIDVFPNPPIDRIVVDGNNVVKTEKKGDKYSVKKLIELYNELQKKYKFKRIIIFISAALKYDVSDFDDLKPLIKKKIVRETPAGVSDDYFIIQFAIKDNTLILTNNLFRDWKEKYPEMKNEIQKRRVTFMIDPNTQECILGEYFYNEDE